MPGLTSPLAFAAPPLEPTRFSPSSKRPLILDRVRVPTDPLSTSPTIVAEAPLVSPLTVWPRAKSAVCSSYSSLGEMSRGWSVVSTNWTFAEFASRRIGEVGSASSVTSSTGVGPWSGSWAVVVKEGPVTSIANKSAGPQGTTRGGRSITTDLPYTIGFGSGPGDVTWARGHRWAGCYPRGRGASSQVGIPQYL